MAHSNPRSLDEIKRETEQTRAGLTETVDQLRSSVVETADDIRQRIHPHAIKAEVSNYISTRGEQLLDDVSAAAKRNPMQAVAVGASLAYPLLRLARTVPLPVLMVGAGLYFAGSKSGQKLTQQASDAAADFADNASELAGKVGQRAQDLGEQLGQRASAAKAYVSDGIGRADDAIAASNDELRRRAEAAGSAMASGAYDIEQRATLAGASVADRVGELKDKTAAMAGATADAGREAVKAARAKASDLTDRAGKTWNQTIEQNPLLVAGVGLLIGGLIASALPRTEIEDGLIGNASRAAKRRAREAAAQGFDKAKQAANQTYDDVTSQAEAEGLTPEAIGKVAQTLGQRVRRVAEAAANTAFQKSNTHPPADGESNHG